MVWGRGKRGEERWEASRKQAGERRGEQGRVGRGTEGRVGEERAGKSKREEKGRKNREGGEGGQQPSWPRGQWKGADGDLNTQCFSSFFTPVATVTLTMTQKVVASVLQMRKLTFKTPGHLLKVVGI